MIQIVTVTVHTEALRLQVASSLLGLAFGLAQGLFSFTFALAEGFFGLAFALACHLGGLALELRSLGFGLSRRLADSVLDLAGGLFYAGLACRHSCASQET